MFNELNTPGRVLQFERPRPCRIARVFLMLALLSLAAIPAQAAVRSTILPDLSINSAGTVCGTVFDEENGLFVSTRGFIREADGTLTTYQFPGRTTIIYTHINSRGTIVGSHTGDDGWVGFIRARDGSITNFEVPGNNYGTIARSINDAGEVAGSYLTDTGVQHGFVRAVDGTITTFDAGGDGRDTHVADINSAGDVTGDLQRVRTDDVLGFVRTARGEITTFAVPGARSTWGLEILSSGVVGGKHGGKGFSFIREPDGTIETFDLSVTAMNVRRMVTGSMVDANNVWHAFVRFADGSLEVFDAPGAGTGFDQGTQATGINSKGEITGIFSDEDYENHGFVRNAQGRFTTFDVPLTTASQVRKPNSQPAPAEVRGPDDGHAVLRVAPIARAGERSALEYRLSEAADVSITVHDLAGRRVATLEHGPRNAGAHTVAWDTSGVPQGVYFYRLQAGRLKASRSLRLIQ